MIQAPTDPTPCAGVISPARTTGRLPGFRRNGVNAVSIAATVVLSGLVAGCQGTPPAPDVTVIDASSVQPVTSTASLDARETPPTAVAPQPPADNRALAVTAPDPTRASDDLWMRMRAGFALEDAEEDAVNAQWKWYGRHPSYIDRTFERSRPYIHYIVEELERRGLPLEFALLPVVESAYDAFAYSHGRAAGLWQIIPSTGRRFGLKQNWWYDGRRDVVAATEAALDYLSFLHDEFDGDWLLAVAGYNAGEGNVRKAVRRNRREGKPVDFWHLKLPRETRAYVPKLLALRRLVLDPAAAGVTLPPLPQQPYFARVELDGQIDLALAAELAGIDVDDVYRLNPGFNRWATDPDGPHRLLVPAHAAPALASALADLPVAERVRWKRYEIKPGDTLSTIASAHQTSTRELKRANSLTSSRIRAGKTLLIPTASRPLDDYALSADARLAKMTDSARSRGATAYTVRPGDSLWTIARDHGVKVRALARWNGMAPGDTLSVGRELVISDARRRPSATGAADTTRRITYTVRNGDSLWRIGSKFRVSVTQLRRWNKLDKSRVLRPGQRLVMYVDVAEQTAGG